MRQMVERWLTVTTASCAILLLVCTVPLPLVLDGAGTPLDWVHDSAWPFLSVMAFVLAALMPFVFMAIYVCQVDETGMLGLVGFAVSSIGCAAYLSFQFDLAFVWPVLAERAPDLLDFDGPMFRYPRFALIHLWMGPLYSVGVLLFGIALIRARVLPRTASALFMIGVILSAGVLFPPFPIRTVGGLLAAPALGWITLVLWRRSDRAPRGED